MTDIDEQTIVISDLLSFLSCKIKLVPKDKLLNTLRQFYSDKDINEAHQTLLASLPEKKSTRHGRRVKNPDSVIAMYECFQQIQEHDLPIFVCKNLNNVPELDIVKREKTQLETENDIDEEEGEEEEESDRDVEQNLREEQKTMKSQIADIAFVVKQLKDQLDSISNSGVYNKSSENERCKGTTKRKKGHSDLRPNKKFIPESKSPKSGEMSGNKQKGIAYLQSLIDQDGERSDKDQGDKDNDSDSQEEMDLSDFEYGFEGKGKLQNISCEVILKEELEDSRSSSQSKMVSRKNDVIFLASSSLGDSQRAPFEDDANSPHKTLTQKVIYIKNEDHHHDGLEEENSIELAADYFGQLDETDPSSRIGTLDSVITLTKNSSPQSIVIEKIEATNGEGCYYKCQRCEFLCNEEKMILKHECNLVKVDLRKRKQRCSDRERSNLWMCTICDKYVGDVIEFNEHMLDHYKILPESGVHECVLCTLRTYDYEQYKQHLFEHSWSIPYVCDLCDYKSTKELRMKRHAIKHLECKGPNRFECLICGKVCGTRNSLEKHKQRHKKNYDFKCDICGLTFRHRSALSQHTLIHTKERTFICQICGYRYDSQHSLNVHIKVHFRDDMFPCHICTLKLKSKNAYRTHVLNVHEGVKSFKCDLCDEAFIFKHTMLIHRKTHGNQTYVCGYCNKNFKSQHYLKIHCAIHEGRNPFKCTSCHFETSSKTILRKHAAVHSHSTSLNLVSCDFCSYVTVCPSEMESHVTANHPNEESKMVIIMEGS